ncbi:hypothetical protein IEQ34_002894 [Dendrobium chrysotoxum]|uniref:Uncharacterized protein n=1 Tax=Dendrobium chrysotoxum TaxID=161865 RepID=A0AAV7HFR7_DENCH|nr:hypothetical protein IEQ34_002894 [Dendrobium chrysotoxum]
MQIYRINYHCKNFSIPYKRKSLCNITGLCINQHRTYDEIEVFVIYSIGRRKRLYSMSKGCERSTHEMKQPRMKTEKKMKSNASKQSTSMPLQCLINWKSKLTPLTYAL